MQFHNYRNRLFLCYLLTIVAPFLFSNVPVVMAFPKKRPVANKTQFSRERVKLHQSTTSTTETDTTKATSAATTTTATTTTTKPAPTPLISREALIKFDVLVGVVYSTGFFLFPAQTLSLFFQYEFDPALQPFLHMCVRMIAINHFGYVGGLLTSPPQKAIKVATSFLTIGGAFVVYYGQAKLETATAFWSCTILTTAMIVAHLLALY